MNIRSLSFSTLIVGGTTLGLVSLLAVLDFILRNSVPWEFIRGFQVAVYYGLLPLLSLVNGILGAFFYRRKTETVPFFHGALAGALGALAGVIVASLVRLATILIYNELFTIREFVVLLLGLLIYSLLGVIGGLIGGAIFHRTTAPPSK
jgi:hypothetical protein